MMTNDSFFSLLWFNISTMNPLPCSISFDSIRFFTLSLGGICSHLDSLLLPSVSLKNASRMSLVLIVLYRIVSYRLLIMASTPLSRMVICKGISIDKVEVHHAIQQVLIFSTPTLSKVPNRSWHHIFVKKYSLEQSPSSSTSLVHGSSKSIDVPIFLAVHLSQLCVLTELMSDWIPSSSCCCYW